MYITVRPLFLVRPWFAASWYIEKYCSPIGRCQNQAKVNKYLLLATDPNACQQQYCAPDQPWPNFYSNGKLWLLMSLVTSSVLVLWFLGFWIFHALCKMKKKLNSRKLNYCGFAQYFYWISAHFQVLYPHRHWQPTVAGIFVYFKYAVIPFSIFSKTHNVDLSPTSE